MKLGSLFDGSGGFPLAGLINGIEPVWASEIEPFPIRVTTKRLPFMKHYGDVSKMDGGSIEPVDIITFGSPCQDMSIAGKREGLDGNRSGLFYEAVRIIKEMREATNGKYPRYIVWENVPGAFSSNKGRDFLTVLEALCSVCDDTVSIPEPYDKKRTKLVWSKAGEIVGDNYSVAWRTLDAQYWGVPQRRKRIYLVADFTGGSAGEILFNESLRGDIEQGITPGQGVAVDVMGSVDRGAGVDINGNVAGTLDASYYKGCELRQGVEREVIALQANGIDRADTAGCDGNAQDISGTIQAKSNGGQSLNYINPVCYDARGNGETLCFDETQITSPANGNNPQWNDHCHPLASTARPPTVICKKPPRRYIIRRLTPTECARLQGFPDWWCSDLGIDNPTEEDISFWSDVWETHRKIMGKSSKPKTRKQIIKWLQNPNSDSAEYKMWGNGIALPCAVFVLGGIIRSFKEKSK